MLRVSSYAGCSGGGFCALREGDPFYLFKLDTQHLTSSRIKEGMQLLDLFESG